MECRVADCESKVASRGYCSKHYQRVMKYGSPAGSGVAKYVTFEEALANRVVADGDCLIWTGSRNDKGYGRYKNAGEPSQVVHRRVWEMHNGPIPDGKEIDHICFNRACVNIKHLRVATRSQNTRHRRGAQPNSKTGVRNVHVRGNRYVVRLKTGGKHFEYGIYDTVAEAAVVAERARRELFGGAR